MDVKDEKEINLIELIELLATNISLIAITIVISVIVGILLCFILKPTYKAEAKLFLQEKSVPSIFKEEQVGKKLSIDYMQLIRSYDVILNVIKNVQPEIKNEDINKEIDKFTKNITLRKEREGYYIVSLFSKVSPTDAEKKLRTLISEFLDYLTNFSKTNFSLRSSIYKMQMENVKKEVEILNEKIKNFLEKQKLTELSEQKKSLIQQISNLSIELASVEIAIEEKKTNVAAIKRELQKLGVEVEDTKFDDLENLKRLNDELISVNDEQQKKQILQQIEKLQNEYRENLARNLRIKMLALPQLERSLLENYIKTNIEILTLEAKKKAIQDKIKEYDKELEKMPQKELELVNLQREYKMKELAYKSLMEKYADSVMATLSDDLQLNIIQPPIAYSTPIFPKKRIVVLVSVIIGLMLGILLVIIKNSLLQPISTEEELQELVKDVVIIGKMPKIHQLSKIDKINIEDFLSNKQLMSYFNLLRNNIKYLYEQYPIVIGISSVTPKEGKSTIVSMLGLSFLEKEKKVLIMDLDFYKHQCVKFFLDYLNQSKNQHYNKLDDKVCKIDTVYEYGEGKLDILYSKKHEFEDIIREIRYNMQILKDTYDVIIVDTPPSVVSEKIYIFKELELDLFLVLNLLVTPKRMLIDMLNHLRRIEIMPKGLILNKLRGLQYYYYYNYYYKYYL